MAIRSLLHFGGADESTVITDEVGVFTWSPNDDAAISTDQSKFGGTSLQDEFGNGHILQDDTFNMSAAWTADVWFRPTVTDPEVGATPIQFLQVYGGVDGNGTFIYGVSDGSACYYQATVTGAFGSAANVSGIKTDWNAGQWYHFEMCYDPTAGKFYFYVDGVKDAEITSGAMVEESFWKWFVGGMRGFFDEFRFTDTCEHPGGTTFTPPDAPYTYVSATNDAEVTLPLLTLESEGFSEGFGDVVLALPLKNILTTGDTDTFGTADMQLPIFTMASAGVVGTAGNFAEELPFFTLLADGNVRVDWTLPLITLNASGIVGTIADIDWLLPMLSLTALGPGASAGASIGNANVVLPLLQVLSASLAEETGSASLLLPMLRLVSGGSLSNLGMANLTLPLFTMDGLGWPIGIGISSMLLPMFELVGMGYHAHVASYHPWALNMRKGALSQYQNFNFNSFAKFNDVVLAADTNGIHVLGEQEKDDTADIEALIRTGNSNFEVSYVKRVPRIYTGYKSDGDLEFRTITTHGGTRAYLLPANGNTMHQQRRVPIGRGPKSAYWQFEIANRGGSDFSIDNMIVYPEVTKRRVI